MTYSLDRAVSLACSTLAKFHQCSAACSCNFNINILIIGTIVNYGWGVIVRSNPV